MPDPIGIALLSFAHVHQHHWAKAIRSDDRTFISGIWDEDAERGQSMAQEFDAPWFDQPEALLRDDRTRAATICAANAHKLGLLRLAAEAGRHVLVEKPPATRVEDVQEMITTVERTGITCVQSFPHRLVPANQTVKAFLDRGELGRVGMVRKRHGHGFAFKGLAEDMPWIIDPALGGGGALLDEGIHEMDLLRHYFGMPESVTAEIGTLQTDYPVDDNAVVLFRFPDGPLVELSCSWTWLAGGPTTEVYGTEGTLLQFFTDCASNDAPDPAGMHLRLWRKGATEWEEVARPFPFEELHQHMARHFVDVLSGAEKPSTTLQDGLQALRMAQGAYRAAQSGKRYYFSDSE